MDFNSPLFDKIRIKSAAKQKKVEEAPACEHEGCQKPGLHRAPKGRGQEGRFWRFCVDHVREYNNTYNYFNGMSDDAVATYQKDAIIGHRPTWSMGVNPAATASGKPKKPEVKRDWGYNDPHGILQAEGVTARPSRRAKPSTEPKRRSHGAVVMKALDTLGLDDTANAVSIKAQYKLLVKRFHPDAHGGDRSYEERLRDIIRAHDTLKAAGLC